MPLYFTFRCLSKEANLSLSLAPSFNIWETYGSGVFFIPSEHRLCKDAPWNSDCSSDYSCVCAPYNIFKTSAKVEKVLSTQEYANGCLVGVAVVD